MADNDAEGKEMTMVDRVARAICAASCESWREPPFNHPHTESLNNHWRFKARAAIAAMREPTKPMLVATEDVVTGYDDFAVGDGTLYLSYGGVNGRDGFYDYAIAAHHAMIDAALKETA
jgi:hypothetical protein